MNRILLCGLWVLLFTPTAIAVWCYLCDTTLPHEKCPPGKMEFCWAGPNASCSTGRIYIARTAWCFQCEKTVADLPCPEIPEFCYAGAGVDCYTQNLYIGHTIVRSEVGCLPDCKTESLPNSFMWHEVICCYHDYCNE